MVSDRTRWAGLLVAAASLATGVFLLTDRAAAEDAESTVTATVIAGFVAVSVDPSDVEYGVVMVGSEDNTPTPGSVTVHNDGNLAMDLNVRGADTDSWMLVTASPGDEEYRHRVSVDGFDTSDVALSTDNASLATGVADEQSLPVSFRLDAPTATAADTAQEAVVTFVALAAE